MKHCRHPFWIALLSLALAAPAASAASGFEPARCSAIQQRLEGMVDNHTIAGAVTLVASHERVLALQAVGFADLGARKPMAPDALFWIASMTKPMTAVAVLMLQEQGKLSLDEPVEKYLPEFKNQWLVEERTAAQLKLVRPARPITLRDLLTHTAGVGDLPAPRPEGSLAEMVALVSQQPLRFPPGSKWEYSTSGIDVLGRIVEVVSGQPFADFLEQRLFRPLDMKDTTFWPTPRQLKRLAKAYKPGPNGALEEAELYFVKGGLSNHQRPPRPGGGLFSTAHDVARFYQMALNGGSLGGKRILAAETLATMTRTQTGSIKTGFTDGMSWGLGFQVVKEPRGVTAMLSPGTFGHGGAYATQSWADPHADRIYILMIQRAGFPNGDDSPVRKAFQEAACGR